MNFTQQDTEQRIMKVLGKDDKDLMQAIQENMFLFENLIESDDRSLQTLLRSVETEDIVVAMKGADEACATSCLPACPAVPPPILWTRWKP